ncbi:hypothetical protein DFH28DRAFT_997811, partial [Melampsora americana]
MVAPEEQKILKFVRAIPHNVNPYFAAANYLEREAKPVVLPPWVQIVMGVIMGGYFIMLLQCLYLFYIRIVTGTFKFYSFTRLNLVKIDVPNLTCLGHFCYCLLVIADLIFQQLINAGLVSDHNKLPLFGIKFGVILSGSWSFIWVCFCQVVTSFWDKSWCSVSPQARTTSLPRPLRWFLNVVFICLALWFIPALFVIFINAESELKKLRAVLKAITSDLRTQGKLANMANYRQMDLLVRLIPARDIVAHRDRMARWFRLGMMIGIIDLLVLCLVYAPLLVISLGTIRKKTSECTFAMATCTAERSVQFKRIERRLADEHRTLLHHALTAYGSTLAFVPVIAWQLSYKGTTFLQNKNWLIVTQIGMHGPFAIGGNIIGFLINQQARRLLKTHRAVKDACQVSSKEKASCSSRESSCPT